MMMLATLLLEDAALTVNMLLLLPEYTSKSLQEKVTI
jgi:hypothetical protein